MAAEIFITFEPGKPDKVETKGIKGKACHVFSKEVIAAIGGKLISDTPTAEATATVTMTEKATVKSKG